MENIYESAFLKIDFSSFQQVLEASWRVGTVEMNAEQYQKEFMNFHEHVIDCQPTFLLIDERQMYFSVVPELQDWATDISKSVPFVPFKKVAIVTSQDVVKQIIAEELTSKSEKFEARSKFFECKNAALAWLIP